ncbi:MULTISPECIES: replication initiation protein [Cupriavidus]|uniref:Initiator replication protein B n=3 Tax=Cupriavidus TaxID=106589 RepID=A0A375HTQ5_9BURK|nr:MULTISPECIES: replication initiation protein [Cupriavidus]MCO4865929.1 replication initiation protein [Cupriavidus sp. WGlv3]MCO4893584.1 replication initiation protein [Cupriavidus sp. WGtm5]ULX56180.1 initiator replication protein B [Cupriavidus taiwanensis]CAP63972.1 putative initiator replication protein B [Cupriavidus taiwanensis LMG 19424]SOY74571.1 putative initiator replication protein B [Cupriavidus taiwanensis]
MAAENPVEIKTRTTPRQMALALFEDMFDLGTSINEANREIGYQRNNFFTEIVNMGLAARRFLDAAYFIVAQEPEVPDQYDVELNYFKWLMRYDSRNLKHLRTIADEAQNAKVRVTNTPSDREPAEDDIWVQVQLIGMVAMHRGRIRFDVHHSLIPHIRDPRKSHWLSLRISTAFTRSLARAIYDKVLPSVPAGRTDWIKLDEMRTWPGKMGANASIFKYFKRDWLEPAVREINEISDIELSYETRTESTSSKKVDRIRFQLQRKDTADAVMASLSDASQIYKILKDEFNLSTRQFTEISENREAWNDDRILQAIEYTRFKLNRGQVKKSPSGYLMKALRDNWRMSEAERTMVQVQTKLLTEETEKEAVKAAVKSSVEHSVASRDEETRARMNEESAQGRAHFTSADTKTRREFIRAWLASREGKLVLRRMKLEPASVSEDVILTTPDLSWYLGQFVFGRVALSRA